MFRLKGPSSLVSRLFSGDWFHSRGAGTSVQVAEQDERKSRTTFPATESEWEQRPYEIAPNVVDIPHKRYRLRISDPIGSAITDVHNQINRYGMKEVLVYCGAKIKQGMPGVTAHDPQPEIDAQELLDRFPDRIVESATKKPIVADIAYDQSPGKTRIYVVFTVGQKLDDRTALFQPV